MDGWSDGGWMMDGVVGEERPPIVEHAWNTKRCLRLK